MYIEEEVGRKTTTVNVSDWENAYKEVKHLLESRFKFDRVEEEKFRHHVERGLIISKINCYIEVDDFSYKEVTLVLNITKDEAEGKSATVTVDSKGEVVTNYSNENGKRSVWYYAFRSIYDKFIYGQARGKWKEDTAELVREVHSELRGSLKNL